MNDDVLKNLGKALYIHKALMKTAEDAKDAVDYFSNIGAFDVGLIKNAYIGVLPNALVGSVRSANLTDDEKVELRKRYGLKDDSNIALRNAGRGVAGGFLGTAAGMPIGALLGGPGGALALGLIGQAVGTQLATDKYSKKNIRHRRSKD